MARRPFIFILYKDTLLLLGFGTKPPNYQESMERNAKLIDAIIASAAECAAQIADISAKGNVAGCHYIITAPRVPTGAKPFPDPRIMPPPREPEPLPVFENLQVIVQELLQDVEGLKLVEGVDIDNLTRIQQALRGIQQHLQHGQRGQGLGIMAQQEHQQAVQRYRQEIRRMQRPQLLAISTPAFGVTEVPVVEPSSAVLARLEFHLPIEAIPDTFNDKLDYTCRGYADLVRLAEGMLPIVNKYKLFGEAPNVHGILQSFRANFGRVQAGLERAHHAVQDPPSRLADVRARLEDANVALRAAQALGASFYRPEKAGPRAPVPLLCPHGCGVPPDQCGHQAFGYQAMHRNQRMCACQRAQVNPGANLCLACIRDAKAAEED